MQNQPEQRTEAEAQEQLRQHNPILAMRSYCDSKILPSLLPALQQVAKEKPREPIEFIANYMLGNCPEYRLPYKPPVPQPKKKEEKKKAAPVINLPEERPTRKEFVDDKSAFPQ